MQLELIWSPKTPKKHAIRTIPTTISTPSGTPKSPFLLGYPYIWEPSNLHMYSIYMNIDMGYSYIWEHGPVGAPMGHEF